MLRCRQWAANTFGRTITIARSSESRLSSLKDASWNDLERRQRHAATARLGSINGTRELSTRPFLLQKPTPIPDRAMASLQTIRAFLSGKRPLDGPALHAAYHASKPHHLHHLTRSEFSNLIALFGTLSACSDSSCVVRMSPFTLSETQRTVLGSVPPGEFGRDWWEFVIELGADQSSLGRRTADPDRYWLMRAHLAQGWTVHRNYRGDDDQESGSVEVHVSRDRYEPKLPTGSTHLVHAHAHYAALAQNHLDESIHYAYLRGLLDMQPFLPSVRVHLAYAFTQLVSNLRFCFEPRLMRLFWHTLHALALDFTTSERQTLLDALQRRLSFSLSPKHVSRTRRLIHLDSHHDEDPVLALRCAILDISTSDEPWVRGEAARMIVHNEWSLLVAVAGRPVNALAQLAPRRINVLLGLRDLGQELGSLERLWDDWMIVLGAEVGQADKVDTAKIDRLILLKFLKAAAIQRSIRVLSGAERLLMVQSDLSFEQDGVQAAEKVKSPTNSLSVVLGAAWACTGTTNLTVLFVRMRTAGFKVEDGRFPNPYMAKLVDLLINFREPNTAWLIAQQCQSQLPVDLVERLARACLDAGLVPPAVSLLSEIRISSDIKFSIALSCLQQCSRRRIILNRWNALKICEALGPQLGHVPIGLRHAAIWMTLNTGLVRLAGLMGLSWNLSRRMQRKLTSRLFRAKLYAVAFGVMSNSQMASTSRFISGRVDSASSSSRFGCSEIDATRRGNILLSRAGKSQRKRLGKRAQMRATLAALARLLRRRGSSTHGHNDTVHGPTRRISARLSFTPDAVTLNILCRALARCTSGFPSSRLRAVFDRLSCVGLCGRPGNHFGTSEADGQDKAIVALAELVQTSDARASFVRHTRPLLKIFLRGFLARGDEEAARVVVGLLEEEDRAWRSGHAER
ncbi:microtubule-actin cross-linking factor 1 [Ceratobasidium sp. AG-Ba]|nr:microtubule-actin cross-linking factor 1 [Ceratobasidium sp. AG-Ba]